MTKDEIITDIRFALYRKKRAAVARACGEFPPSAAGVLFDLVCKETEEYANKTKSALITLLARAKQKA